MASPSDFKYSMVAGAVTGGGLTVIANAPNPAGFAILKDSFEDGIDQRGRPCRRRAADARRGRRLPAPALSKKEMNR